MQEDPESQAEQLAGLRAWATQHPPGPQAGAPPDAAVSGAGEGPHDAAPPPAAPAWMNDPTRLAEFAERLAACGTRAFRHPSGLALTFEGGRKAPAGDSRW